MVKSLLVSSLLFSQVAAFSVTPSVINSPLTQQQRPTALSPLFMGRAAAVREKTKGKTDMKKTKINASFGKRIIMAVKQGGSPEPTANTLLANIIRLAKNNNVPVDNINRAIKRASEASTGDFTESTFEVYGFGGASLVINCLSDNANRCSSDVKMTVNKRNGKIAESGSVLFMYDRKGMIEVPVVLDEEALLDVAIEAGIDDFELFPGDEEGTSIVYTDPTDAGAMAEAVKGMGHSVKMCLTYVSKAPVECTDEDFELNMDIIDALEDLDDVDIIQHNMSN